MDIKKLFLGNISNHHTARAREIDLGAFEEQMKMTLLGFLQLSQDDAVALLSEYCELLFSEKRTASTINRRLASVRAMVRFGKTLDVTRLDDACLVGEFDVASSPPTWLDRATCQKLITLPDVTTHSGIRDQALLRLLCEVPLLGWQIHMLRIASFQEESGLLQVPLQNEAALDDVREEKCLTDTAPSQFIVPVKLSKETSESIQEYLLQSARAAAMDTALFRNIDRRPYNTGLPLVPGSVLHLVKTYGNSIGFPALNTRTLRISAIMNALIEADWNPSDARQRFPHVNYWTWERCCAQHKIRNKETR